MHPSTALNLANALFGLANDLASLANLAKKNHVPLSKVSIPSKDSLFPASLPIVMSKIQDISSFALSHLHARPA